MSRKTAPVSLYRRSS